MTSAPAKNATARNVAMIMALPFGSGVVAAYS
jgi:hypothetical protein